MPDHIISKIDNDKRLVFGWAQVAKDKDGKTVVDHDGDFIEDVSHLEDAAYDFVLKSRDGGVDHLRRGVSTLVESVMLTKEKQEAMGIPEGTVPEAWWIGFKVHDETVWKGVKEGRYKMFSVHGNGKRKSRDPEGPTKVATRKSRSEIVVIEKSPATAMARDILDRRNKLSVISHRPKKFKPIKTTTIGSKGPKRPKKDRKRDELAAFNRRSLPHTAAAALKVIRQRQAAGLMKSESHGPSIKNPKVYEALRRKGYSKSKAAAISNGQMMKSGPTPSDVHVIAPMQRDDKKRKKNEYKRDGDMITFGEGK